MLTDWLKLANLFFSPILVVWLHVQVCCPCRVSVWDKGFPNLLLVHKRQALTLGWAAKILVTASPCLTQGQLWNEEGPSCHRNVGTPNQCPSNPVLGVGLVITIIKVFLPLKPLETESSQVPKEASWHFFQRCRTSPLPNLLGTWK